MRSWPRTALLLAAVLAAASCTDPRSILFVGPQRVECVGAGPQLCMLVREKPDADWELFYDGIEGFAFEPGYNYKLLVRKSRVENPVADASSIRWRLIRILEKRLAS